MYKPIFIAGPCVIETFDILEEVAKELVRLNNKYGINIIFKSSLIKQIVLPFILIAARI